MRQRTSATHAVVVAALALVLLPAVAAAGPYAAMDEVPVRGGQLRLATAVTGAGPTEVGCPLKQTHVSVRATGAMARFDVEQVFENQFDTPIEAVYLFPLGDEAAVIKYEIAIGERTIAGTIKRRGEARTIYEEARAAGHTAGLLEQEKPNIFSQRIANIPAKATVTVKFRYVERLDFVDGRYELVFPTVIGPRYLPATGRGRRPIGVASIPYDSGAHHPAPLTFTARLDTGVPIGGVSSPSHAVSVRKIDDTTAQVGLTEGAAIPNRDLILRYAPAGEKTTVGLLTHRNAAGGFFSLVISPKAEYRTGDITPREVVFLIDTSGSMSGTPLEHARQVARAVIGTLGDADTFNVVQFASGTSQLASAPIRATAEGKERGLLFIASLQASGGTEMERGVLTSLARKPGADRVRMVYVLSDGFVGNDDRILAAAQKHLGHNRIFPVGIGSAPNRYLLDRLAAVGRGFASYVALTDSPGEVEDVVGDLVRRTAHPYLTDLAIDWGGLKVVDVTPARLPDVYAGMPVVVMGRYAAPGRGTIELVARKGGEVMKVPLAVELPESRWEPGVAYLWARQRVLELMSANHDRIDAATERAVTKLGLDFHMVTDFTSFVAVDRTRVVDKAGRARTVVQHAPMPEGVNYETTVGASPPASRPPPSNYRPSGGSSSSRSWGGRGGGGGGGGGGGDMDPLTWLIVLALIPMAIKLRRGSCGR